MFAQANNITLPTLCQKLSALYAKRRFSIRLKVENRLLNKENGTNYAPSPQNIYN
ncbi:hypothetical protein SCA04_06210 [Staphylococcus carnosus]|nr:hypothetical protein SCA04_06210 [Staphylococcus carnosus]GEP80127.1 hypothetical protein SCA05_19200 [Staphylococcus carnosus]